MDEYYHYDCANNTKAYFYMWGGILGSIIKYPLSINYTRWSEYHYTECIYRINDEVYEQIISNGYMDEPNMFINKGQDK